MPLAKDLTLYLHDDVARYALSPAEQMQMVAGLSAQTLEADPEFVKSASKLNQYFAVVHEVLARDDAVQAFTQAVQAQPNPAARADTALAVYMLSSDSMWYSPQTLEQFGKPISEALPDRALAMFAGALELMKPSRAFDYVLKREGLLMGVAELADVGEVVSLRAFGPAKGAARRDEIERCYYGFRKFGSPPPPRQP